MQTILTSSIHRQPGQTESLKGPPETMACYSTTISNQPPIKSAQEGKLIPQAYSDCPRETCFNHRTIRKSMQRLVTILKNFAYDHLHRFPKSNGNHTALPISIDMNRTGSTSKFLITDHLIQKGCSLILRM